MNQAVARSFEAEEGRRQFERSRLDMMRAYAETTDTCRRDFLLAEFLDEAAGWDAASVGGLGHIHVRPR